MEYIKFILVIVGFCFVISAKIKYTKRSTIINDNTIPYSKYEKCLLYGGYILFSFSFLIIFLTN